VGRGVPSPSDYGSGRAYDAPNSQAGSGAEPRSKMDSMHILGQKEANWNTIFSIFERRQGPQTSRGPRKLSPLSPLDGAGDVTRSREKTKTRSCRTRQRAIISTSPIYCDNIDVLSHH